MRHSVPAALVAVLLLAPVAGSATAGWWWPNCIKAVLTPTCCPDDYRPKELPRAPCVPPCGANDYCRKPLPPLPLPAPCRPCDDYVHKPCIELRPAFRGPEHTCGPTER